MIVNCFAQPGDIERVALLTVDDGSVVVGDVLWSTVDVETVTGSKRWRIVSLNSAKNEADAVGCT